MLYTSVGISALSLKISKTAIVAALVPVKLATTMARGITDARISNAFGLLGKDIQVARCIA